MLSYGQGAQNVSNNMSKTCSLAKAKFDNFAESHDELAFRKGDVLTIVDQKIEGLEGWWLCSFRGKQGIVPANRVTLLAGLYHESALRFSTSPESSISDGGTAGPDYDIPKHDLQNRKLPPVPTHSSSAAGPDHSRTNGQPPIRELVYDIPKSLEKSRVELSRTASSSHSISSLQPSLVSSPHVTSSRTVAPSGVAADNMYDILPSGSPTPLHVLSSAGSMTSGQRISSASAPISPQYQSGDSAVDMRSNRSSMMSSTSSPPGSGQYDYNSGELYDTPNSYMKSAAFSSSSNHRHMVGSRSAEFSSTLPAKTGDCEQGYYDIPKTLRETLHDYRDSGIYDNNARISIHQSSPHKDPMPCIYDQPSSLKTSTDSVTSSALDQSSAVYDVLPPSVHKSSPQTQNVANKMGNIDIGEFEKLSLELEEAIEIGVKLQQHVDTSSNRLLSFVHSKWRLRSNLESVLYDLKIACVGFQSTLQEFYEFGAGSLVNSASLNDKTILHRLSQALTPLKTKLDIVNVSMKSLSSMKWHMAKLEQTSTSPNSDNDHDLVRLIKVAKEISEDVNRVASVIHGNSSLLFKSNSSVQSLLSEAKEAAISSKTSPSSSKCLVNEESIELYHEYDYCDMPEVLPSQTEDTNIVTPSARERIALDLEQDCQYLRYYLQHVHTICDRVRDHMMRLEQSLGSREESNKPVIVKQSRELVATAHELVYIGDTLCRYIRSSHIQLAVSQSANLLCNVLKDFIMGVKDLVTVAAGKTSVQAAYNTLQTHIKGIQQQAESFINVISTYCR